MIENNPIISILMTAFNRQEFISEAIESVLSSTFNDFELIIVDDCSKDRTFEIAKSYEAKDNRVKVYVNEQNLGDYPNRNKAASYAKGKYIKYVDADDMVYPYGLEYIVKYMESYPQADWGLTDINQDDNAIFPYLLNDIEIYKSHYFTVGNIFSKAPSSLVIKKSFFNETKGFINLKMIGDTEYFYRLALNSTLLIMPYGFMWCRGQTLGSQTQTHKNNIAICSLYDEVEYYYINKINVNSSAKQRNNIRRLKNYVKIILGGPSTIKSYFSLKKELTYQIKSKLN